MKLTKKNIKALEKLGWSVSTTDYGYFLQNYSPCGGDMGFDAQTKEDIIEYCENFDAEEEFRVWYGAKNGEPTTPNILWEDCLAKAEMLDALAEVLK